MHAAGLPGAWQIFLNRSLSCASEMGVMRVRPSSPSASLFRCWIASRWMARSSLTCAFTDTIAMNMISHSGSSYSPENTSCNSCGIYLGFRQCDGRRMLEYLSIDCEFNPAHVASRPCTRCLFGIGSGSDNTRPRHSGTLSRAATATSKEADSHEHLSAGNGSLVRLAPVPLTYACNPADAIERSGESSRTPHGAIAAVDACRDLGGLIVGALQGTAKKDLLADRYSPIPGYWDAYPLAPEIADVAAGSFKRRHPPESRGTGYVVRSLEAALWAFNQRESFQDGC
jgi:ADP-ribosylglycohydrolase